LLGVKFVSSTEFYGYVFPENRKNASTACLGRSPQPTCFVIPNRRTERFISESVGNNGPPWTEITCSLWNAEEWLAQRTC